jgi:hypothetical protein
MKGFSAAFTPPESLESVKPKAIRIFPIPRNKATGSPSFSFDVLDFLHKSISVPDPSAHVRQIEKRQAAFPKGIIAIDLSFGSTGSVWTISPGFTDER